MVRCSYSVKVHTHADTLESGDRNLFKKKEPGNRAEKAKEKVFGNKKKRMKAHIDKPLETKAEWWQKQKMKELLVPRGPQLHHCLGKDYQYLQKKQDVTDSSIEELGSAKTNILMWELFMSSSTKAAVHLGQKDVENNRMVMDVYVEEMKYLFSIVQKLVLENYDETLNVKVIDSNAP